MQNAGEGMKGKKTQTHTKGASDSGNASSAENSSKKRSDNTAKKRTKDVALRTKGAEKKSAPNRRKQGTRSRRSQRRIQNSGSVQLKYVRRADTGGEEKEREV